MSQTKPLRLGLVSVSEVCMYARLVCRVPVCVCVCVSKSSMYERDGSTNVNYLNLLPQPSMELRHKHLNIHIHYIATYLSSLLSQIATIYTSEKLIL